MYVAVCSNLHLKKYSLKTFVNKRNFFVNDGKELGLSNDYILSNMNKILNKHKKKFFD